MPQHDDDDHDDAVADLLQLIARRRGVDFRDHRRETIARGIAQRVQATRATDIRQYAARLEQDPAETDRLIEVLVVPVSSFFRDREVFDALETIVIPQQLAHTAGPLRTWVAGAATGEEAWSWTILMVWCREMFGGPPFELLASDIDARSLAIARAGRYPVGAATDVPQRFKERFLDSAPGQVVISAELRDRVLFAQHDLMGPTLAPPSAILASFQIISFRNVLIYLDRRLQHGALQRLRSILKPDGVLVLGLVETLAPDLAESFIAYPGTPAALHIYQRRR